MTDFYDVFISYGRADSEELAFQVKGWLETEGLTVWLDYAAIPPGVDFQHHIRDGISRAHNFVFLMSPHAVNSAYCRMEIDLAVSLGKRIVPVMHVEALSRSDWQARYPDGTDQTWANYQAQGLHSSLVNLPPAISRINWIYCRTGLDLFEPAMRGLLATVQTQQACVQLHTILLQQAQTWQRYHRQTTYLLRRPALQQAQTWLAEAQDQMDWPCQPTLLQCEYITESAKHAAAGLAQVYLCYTDADAIKGDRLAQTLLRSGVTLWTTHLGMTEAVVSTRSPVAELASTRISEPTSANLMASADYVVILLSPALINSGRGRQELLQAFHFEKPVIPIVIEPVEALMAQLSRSKHRLNRIYGVLLEEGGPAAIGTDEATLAVLNQLQTLEAIDLTQIDWNTEAILPLGPLFQRLQEDSRYFANHKQLLIQALRWQDYQHQPSLLLQGHGLKQAETWLTIAEGRASHGPTPLQRQFIQASLEQPVRLEVDVFIAYSCSDADFAQRLNLGLQTHGKTTWFDQENIAPGVANYNEEIWRGIETANTFLFVISPAAIEATACSREISYARQLHKRLVTVLYQHPDTDPLPDELADIQRVDFSHEADFEVKLKDLLRLLDTDPQYVQDHTKFLVQALEWDKAERDESRLLHGKALQLAEAWLATAAGKMPAPTPLQQELITASQLHSLQAQRSVLRLQRLGIALVSLISLVAFSLGGMAFYQSRLAAKRQAEAEVLKTQAQLQAMRARTTSAQALFQSDQYLDALFEAMGAGIAYRQMYLTNPSALPVDLSADLTAALHSTVAWVQEFQRIEDSHGIVWDVAISADGSQVATVGADQMVRIYRRSGELMNTLPTQRSGQALAVAFAPDRQQVVVGTESGQVLLWSPSRRQVVTLDNSKQPVTSVAFAPDGQQFATASEDGLVRLWQLDGTLVLTLSGQASAVRSVAFSPDGDRIVSGGDNGTIRLWHRNGTPITTLTGHQGAVYAVTFSPDGQWLASASWDGTARIWQADGQLTQVLRGHNTLLYDIAFSPDSRTLATASWDKTIKLWALNGDLITTLHGHNDHVRALAFNPVDGTLVSAGGDRTVRFWRQQHLLLTSLPHHSGQTNAVAFSPDSQLIATGGNDYQLYLWTGQGQPLGMLADLGSVIWDLKFSPDGQFLAVATSDGIVRLLQPQTGQVLARLEGHRGPVRAIDISADSQLIATSASDRTVRLWQRDGTPLLTIPDLAKDALTVRFSPNGRLLAAAGWDGRVRLWTLDGQLQKTFTGHQGWIYDLNFSPDGQTLASAGYDNTARLWRLDAPTVLRLEGHISAVVGVEFSPDNRYIATASYDNSIKLWTPQGQLITTLYGHKGRILDIAISPDGQRLISASEDGQTMLWDLHTIADLDQLLVQGCHWLGDYLTLHGEERPDLQHYCQENAR